jgi:hypothetical protein
MTSTAWVAVTLGVVFALSLVSVVLAIALKCFRETQETMLKFTDAHRATLNSLEKIHDKNSSQLNGVLDRFMALDFSLFKSYQSTELAEEGGYEDPIDLQETGVITYNPGGRPIRPDFTFEEELRKTREEQELLAEDFGTDFEEKEGLKS